MPGMGYPSDAPDAEWNVIFPLLPAAKPGGRPRTTSLRDAINAIFYVSRGGGAWRMLPKDFPPYQTVYRYYRAWNKDGTWQRVHDALRDQVRQKEGRDQSECSRHRQPERQDDGKGSSRGYDAGKKVKGRKRHIVVDTLGLILDLVVHPADVQDRDGGKLVLEKLDKRFPLLKKIWADGTYAGKLVDWAKEFGEWVLEIVKRSDGAKGFELLPPSVDRRKNLCMAGPLSSVE